MGRLREVKDSVRARWSLSCMRGGSSIGHPQGVEDGPILRAQIKRDEVPSPVMPRATTDGSGCMCGDPRWGEVVRAGPPGGGFPKTEDLVYLRLLELRNGGVDLEYFKKNV